MSGHLASSFVYLASASPRRSQLLDQLGVRHRPLVAGPDEDAEALEAPLAGESPDTYVERVARAKLDAALARLARRGLEPAPVLAADTTVALDGRMLGKPVDRRDAEAMLVALSDRTHRVLTCVAVGAPGVDAHVATSISNVRFGRIAPGAIARSIESGEPFGKAGAYAIQGGAAAWVAHLDGSHTGVMGLPLHETSRLLHAFGIAAGP